MDIATMQYVLPAYIQSCNSIPPLPATQSISPQNMQLPNKPTNRSNAAPAVRSKNAAGVSWRVLFAYSVADQLKLPCALYFMPQSGSARGPLAEDTRQRLHCYQCSAEFATYYKLSAYCFVNCLFIYLFSSEPVVLQTCRNFALSVQHS